MDKVENHCLSCNKPLKGRSDKKFCNDYCRNAYNNAQNSNANNLIRNINNILRRNRRILNAHLPLGQQTAKISKKELGDHGFNFNFHTHIFTNSKGQTYFFCYEYGYLLLEKDWVLIVIKKEKSTDEISSY